MPSTRNAAKPKPANETTEALPTRSTRNSNKNEPTPEKAGKEKVRKADEPEPKKKREHPEPPIIAPKEAKPKKAGKGKKDDGDHETNDPPAIQKPVDSPQPSNQKEEKQQEEEAAKEEKELKKAVLKGAVPVDQFFSKPTTYKIYAQGERTFAATLNQSNIEANNNKFYIIQLLQHETTNDFLLFTRWGRVGVQGQSSEAPYKNKEAAVKDYNKKLNEKKKTYKEVEMNYEENAEPDHQAAKEAKAKEQEGPASTLPPAVQQLIRLIFDMGMMARQMKEIGYDANKMPLGKLAKSSILKGYSILQEIMAELKGKNRSEVVNRLSGDFYSEIPHNFGFRKMTEFALRTEQKVKEKLEMLQSLEDIQVFTRLVDEQPGDRNSLDSNYLKLATRIAPLDRNSPTYQLLLDYVHNTHAHTHTAYRLEVQDIFELEKAEEVGRFKAEIGNRQLLWHGSRLTNFVGILSQGLRIAPPEAPVTGYMFGKGVYFADMVTKSANYCFASRENDTGLMLLCEVALGNVNEKFYADYYANLLPEGKQSTKGCGKTAPTEGKMLGEVLVPCGTGGPTGISNCSLLYNEFIVYDVAQIKCRYLFRMKFVYN